MHGYAEIFEQVHAMNADIDRVAKELGSAGAWSAWIGKTQELSMEQDQKLMALKELLLKNGFTSFKDF